MTIGDVPGSTEALNFERLLSAETYCYPPISVRKSWRGCPYGFRAARSGNS